MLLHAANCAENGHKNILIRTVDSDVVLLAIAFFHKLSAEKLFVSFGTGKNFKIILAHEIAEILGHHKFQALLFFHAITGCETTSSFYGKGKKMAWEARKSYEDTKSAFIYLSSKPKNIPPDIFNKIEKYVITLYSKTCTSNTCNEAQRILFTSGRTVENIPPTSDALRQHALKAAFQSGYVWYQCLSKSPYLPNPEDWGWIHRENSL